MAMDVVVRPLEDPHWAAFVAHHPAALPFHDPSWAGLIAECYRLRAFGLTAVDRCGRIVAGIPVVEVRRPRRAPRWVTLPFTDHCPPLTDGPDDAAFTASLDRARRAHGIARLEVRAALSGPVAQPCGAFLTHRLTLAGTEADVFAALHPNQVRRNIRRAERAGVTVRAGTVEADVTETFYRLHVKTRHRLGVPVQPRRYFRLLWRRVLAPGHGIVLVAALGDTPVAAGVFLASDATCIYKYGASDERHWPARPNHPLFWAAIRWAMARGCRTFDFGRTDIGDDGLRAFKSRWGTAEDTLAYSVLADAPVPAARSGALPAPLRALLRRGPRVVPRVVGEVLYRYTA